MEPELDSDGEPVWEVELIMGARLVGDGQDESEYYVKWANWPNSASTWEPEENVEHCTNLLEIFWKHVGRENKAYKAGRQVLAQKAWIKKEMANFKRNQIRAKAAKHKAQEGDHDSADDEPKGNSSTKNREPELTSYTAAGPDTTSDDDRPIFKHVKGGTKKSVKPGHVLESEVEELGGELQDISQNCNPGSASPTSIKQKKNVRSPSPYHDLFSGSDTSPEEAIVVLESTIGLTKSDVPAKKVVPAHRRRKLNPQIKQLELTELGPGSALSTKNRIVQGISSNGSFNSLFPKPTLSHLSFKKNVEQPQKHIDLPDEPDCRPHLQLETTENFSPVRDMEPPGKWGSASGPEPVLDSPMDEDPLTNFDGPGNDFEPTSTTSPSQWGWSGELVIHVSKERKEKLCEVAIQNPTEPKSNEIQFSKLLQNKRPIQLENFNGIKDLLHLRSILQQVAQLVSVNGSDQSSFDTLCKYMTSQRKVAYATEGGMRNDLAALMVIFPPLSDICRELDIPKGAFQGARLLVGLVPFSSEIKHRLGSSSSDQVLRNYPRYARAVQTLKFPTWLHDFMPGRSFCVWFAPFDGNQHEHGTVLEGKPDTRGLLSILAQLHAKNVGYKADVRVIFVHVGAIHNIHQLEAFCERRFRRPEIQFITYGSHPTVEKNRWGIREIYVLGGIVTIAPRAIVSDIAGVCEIVQQIARHPRWKCYILPSVVGLALRIAEETFKDDPEIYQLIADNISERIRAGDITVLNPSLKSLDKWTLWQPSVSLSDAAALLEECLAVFNSRYANTSLEESEAAVIKEVCADMLSMQLQPMIMDEFRRYVVLTNVEDERFEKSNTAPYSEHPWLEWRSFISFDFRDDFSKGDSD